MIPGTLLRGKGENSDIELIFYAQSDNPEVAVVFFPEDLNQEVARVFGVRWEEVEIVTGGGAPIAALPSHYVVAEFDTGAACQAALVCVIPIEAK